MSATCKKFRLGPGQTAACMQVRKFDGRGPRPSCAAWRPTRSWRHHERDDGGAKGIRVDWREPVKRVVPVQISEARREPRTGITRTGDRRDHPVPRVRGLVGWASTARRDELLPVIVRAAATRPHRASRTIAEPAEPPDLELRPPSTYIPHPAGRLELRDRLRRIRSSCYRMNRKRTITVHADPVSGPPERGARPRLMPQDRRDPAAAGSTSSSGGGEYRELQRAAPPPAINASASRLFFDAPWCSIVITLFNDAASRRLIIWLTACPSR